MLLLGFSLQICILFYNPICPILSVSHDGLLCLDWTPMRAKELDRTRQATMPVALVCSLCRMETMGTL